MSQTDGMKLAALRLRQRDGVSCGPTVAVVAGALLDPAYRARLLEPGEHTVGDAGWVWFLGEQVRVHAEVNRVWPRRLGTTPMGMARALTARGAAVGARYRWRLFRGRRDRLADVSAALLSDRPVPMLIGRRIPRHWVLLVGKRGVDHVEFDCYEPSSGHVISIPATDIRHCRLTGPGYPCPFGFVVPGA